MENPGSMLWPCVTTYVVPPPREVGQNSHMPTSTSATAALVLAIFVAAFMARGTHPGSGGRPSGRPPRPTLLSSR